MKTTTKFLFHKNRHQAATNVRLDTCHLPHSDGPKK